MLGMRRSRSRSGDRPRWGRRILLAVVVLGIAAYFVSQIDFGTPQVVHLPSQSAKPAPTTSADPTVSAGVPADDYVETARDVAQNAKSVHLAGTADIDGGQVEVDLTLTSDDASGTVTVAGTAVEVRRVGTSIWTRPAGRSGDGGWVEGDQIDTADGTVSLFDVTDRSTWYELVFPSPEGATASATPQTLDGQSVRLVQLRDNSRLYLLADESAPYPVKQTGAVANPSELTFTDWDRAVDITAPTSR